MIITLDGRRLTNCPTTEPLQDMLEHIRRTCLGERLIVAVAVNGEPLGDDALRHQLRQPLDSEAQLDLQSSDRRTLVADALRGLALEFGDARTTQQPLAEQFSAGAFGDAIRSVGTFIELWQTAQRALAQCSELLGADLTLWEHGGRPVRAWLRELVEKLNELRGALESRDLVLLGDLIRYEFLPLCGTWQELFTDLADQCPVTAGTPAGAPA